MDLESLLGVFAMEDAQHMFWLWEIPREWRVSGGNIPWAGIMNQIKRLA